VLSPSGSSSPGLVTSVINVATAATFRCTPLKCLVLRKRWPTYTHRTFSSLFYSLLSRRLSEALSISSAFPNFVYGQDYTRFKSLQRQEIFLFSKKPHRMWGTRSLPIRRVLTALYSEVNQPRREADKAPPSSVGFYNWFTQLI
jgi:hypothetical protein